MQDLRLLRVHDDGEHLVLCSSDGKEFRLCVDERLFAAVRQDKARLGQLQNQTEGRLRPRDIQARIRAGASVEQVVADSGLDHEHVDRFGAPVIAEREYIATVAQKTPLRATRTPGTPRLGPQATERLAARGAMGEPTWDAWRLDHEPWTIQVSYQLGGMTRTACWHFTPNPANLEPLDEDARSLTKPEPVQQANDAITTGWRPDPFVIPVPEPVDLTVHEPVPVSDRDGQDAREADEVTGRVVVLPGAAQNSTQAIDVRTGVDVREDTMALLDQLQAQRGNRGVTARTPRPPAGLPAKSSPKDLLPSPSDKPRLAPESTPNETPLDSGPVARKSSNRKLAPHETAATKSPLGRSRSRRSSDQGEPSSRRSTSQRPLPVESTGAAPDQGADSDGSESRHPAGKGRANPRRRTSPVDLVVLQGQHPDALPPQTSRGERSASSRQPKPGPPPGSRGSREAGNRRVGRGTVNPNPSKPQDDEPTTPANRPAPRSRARGSRASMPSWDDIMFGGRRDGEQNSGA